MKQHKRGNCPEAIKCHLCEHVFADKQQLIGHLIDTHQRSVQDYLNKKVIVTECLRKGCDVLHSTKDLTPSSICPSCGYPIGHWAYRWAASFIAASG